MAGIIDRIAYELGFALRKTTDVVSSGRRAVSRRVVAAGRSRRRRSGRVVPRPVRATATRVQDRTLRRLVIALSDTDPAARARAVKVVGELSPEVATDLLADAVHDPDPGVRCAAAAAAARAKANGVVFSLILGLDDPDAKVRAAMTEALASITGKELDLGGDEASRRAQIDELKRWWKQMRLEQLTGTPDAEAAK